MTRICRALESYELAALTHSRMRHGSLSVLHSCIQCGFARQEERGNAVLCSAPDEEENVWQTDAENGEGGFSSLPVDFGDGVV